MWPVQPRNDRRALLLALLLALPADAGERQAYSEQSPAWLAAVGKLEVPASRWQDGRRRHHREDCSATLVATRPDQRADTVVTAWHCLEYYKDLSRPLVFTLLPGSGDAVTREVYRVADGGSMGADWAILKMHQPVAPEQVAAITPHPQDADAGRPVSMAGYSRDTGLGNGGATLTYDDNCAILQQWEADMDTDCSAYKGASGGAVIQMSAGGEAWFSGVISRGDSEQLSIFVPVARFRSTLLRYLDP